MKRTARQCINFHENRGRQVSYPWIAVSPVSSRMRRIKGCAGCCASSFTKEGTKVPIYQVQFFRPRQRRREEDFRGKRAPRGWRGTTMTAPPDAHQYPCVGCHIFLPIQMTPPRGPIPVSSVLRSSVTRSPLPPEDFFFTPPIPFAPEIIPFL